jgi:hypothetical protein
VLPHQKLLPVDSDTSLEQLGQEALVLCCDEKSQCQALERTQPGLPLGVGHIRTRTHDYIRHGTLTSFAALNYLEGKLISRIAKRTRTRRTRKPHNGAEPGRNRRVYHDLASHLGGKLKSQHLSTGT